MNDNYNVVVVMMLRSVFSCSVVLLLVLMMLADSKFLSDDYADDGDIDIITVFRFVKGNNNTFLLYLYAKFLCKNFTQNC